MPFATVFTQSYWLSILGFLTNCTYVILKLQFFLRKLVLILMPFYLSISTLEEFFNFFKTVGMTLFHELVILLRMMPLAVNFNKFLSCSFNVNHIEFFSSGTLRMVRFSTIVYNTWNCTSDSNTTNITNSCKLFGCNQI